MCCIHATAPANGSCSARDTLELAPGTCSVCNRPEFAETDRFKVPESKEVITERVQTNLEYYSGNYLAIAGICFAMVWYVS